MSLASFPSGEPDPVVGVPTAPQTSPYFSPPSTISPHPPQLPQLDSGTLRRPPTPPARRPGPTRPDPTLGAPVQPAPGTLVLTPTRYRAFAECPRRYFLAYVLRQIGRAHV